MQRACQNGGDTLEQPGAGGLLRLVRGLVFSDVFSEVCGHAGNLSACSAPSGCGSVNARTLYRTTEE
jgi:hypothetical protein